MVVAAVGLGAWARRRSVSLGLPRPGKELPTDQEYLAMARALAKLEELKAKGRVDEKTYLRLRSEYEKRLAGQGKSAA